MLANTPLAMLAENLLLLRQVEQRGHLRRLFSVLKARFAVIDTTIREHVIRADRGIDMNFADAASPGAAGSERQTWPLGAR